MAAMGAYARRNAAIATSIGALVVALLLIIFFGAWAVSASSEADLARVLSGAASGFSGAASPQSGQPVAASAASDPNYVPRLATAQSGGNQAADSWWGKALLGACPLH